MAADDPNSGRPLLRYFSIICLDFFKFWQIICLDFFKNRLIICLDNFKLVG